MKVNSMYFDKDQVKSGEFSAFLTTLMNLSYGKNVDLYNDIHIYPEDLGAFTIEWAQVPWNQEYGGNFKFVEEDEVVMKEYMLPDKSYVYCIDEEDCKEKLDEFLKEHPTYEKDPWGNWFDSSEYSDIKGEKGE